ncbi:DUF2937 family protein [Limibacillus halophilus]|jgi:hypothetical protein
MLLRLFTRRLPEAACGGLGGAGACQFPSYYAQYLQSLGGRLDQAREQAARLEASAADLGLSAEAFIAKLTASPDDAVQRSGDLAQALLDDRARLEDAYRLLAEAPVWQRPFAFAAHADPAVAQAALERFQPALPVTPEGFAYGALGLLLGLVLLVMARGLFARRRKTRQKESFG